MIKVINKNDNVHYYVESILQADELRNQITYHKIIAENEGNYSDTTRPFSTAIINLLKENNINLYSHQALATDYIRSGKNVVIATPTASGKSLIYNLPVIESCLKNPESRALYLFPLKALAQDQIKAFDLLVSHWPSEVRPKSALYDGDTSDHFRKKIRNDLPNVLVTNPDMLHLGILPYHDKWTNFFANLDYVIVDEAHTYRGVFGSHMAQVFRRMNRISARYGAKPVYIFCTATVGNPDELAKNLLGEDSSPIVIDKSGSPQGKRHFIFVNPDLSPSTTAIRLLNDALSKNLRTIVYCRSRKMTELVSIWASQGRWKNKISAYRAGFLPEERRKIEEKMSNGKLLAVVSTSALELGIDIGGLDVCILVGYPGTIMSTLQRGGRVGRSNQESVVVLIAGEDALDQYFIKNPEDFFSRDAELAIVNPNNEVILARHLECAASEMPLKANEPWLLVNNVKNVVKSLCMDGKLLETANGEEYLASRKNPHRSVDIRGTGYSYTIENENESIIATIDGYRAYREAHEGAVYLHCGQSYVIENLDSGSMRIKARKNKVSWFTRARNIKNTEILKEYDRLDLGRCLVCKGKLRISEQVTSYEKRTTTGNKLLTIVPLDLPVQVFETEGIWYVIPDNIRQNLENKFIHFMGSIHALEHALIGLMPLHVMADRNDFGGISTPLHEQTGLASVFIYDGLAGGAGLTSQAFNIAKDLLIDVKKVISMCNCEDGCPSCVHSPKCGSGNRPISKSGAISLLDELLSIGNEGEKLKENLKISINQNSLVNNLLININNDKNDNSQDFNELEIKEEVYLNNLEKGSFAKQEFPNHYIVFDVETRYSATEVGGWHRTNKMGVSVAVLYDSIDKSFYAYGQEKLDKMFERMQNNALIIGFNSRKFDYAVLQPFADFSLRSLPTLDLLERVYESLKYRVSLDNLGQATLGEAKSANGLLALKWWKEGKIEEIRKYCEKDVDLTHRLYCFGLQNGYVLFTNKNGKKVKCNVKFF